jgi:UDP-glucose 4-epimerase
VPIIQKVLITGGAGFIGMNVTKKLAASGIEVKIFDDFSSSSESSVSGLNLDIVKGTITDRILLEDTAADCDAIIHLAARGSVPRSISNPEATFQANIQGTINVCEIARLRSIPIVFSSSSSVYGLNDKENKSEDEWLAPISPYAASKLSGEAIVAAYSRTFNFPTAVFRLFNVYGPGQRPEHQYSAVIPRWIWAAMRKDELMVYGDGETTRDFTYVDNVVDVLVSTLINKRYFDGITNLAFGNPSSLNTALKVVQDFFPTLKTIYLEPRPGDIRSSANGSNRLKQLFPEIMPTNLRDGINKTITWLLQEQFEIESNPVVVLNN